MFNITPTQKTESVIQKEIIDLLQEQPKVYLVKVHSATKAGVPDILTCIHGRFVALEVKTLKGKASELQLTNIKRIREAGGLAFVVRSRDEVKHIINQLMNGEL